MGQNSTLDPVLVEVRDRMKREGLTEIAAARAMGVTPASLHGHLLGEYVRSDSLARYRRWLACPPGAALAAPDMRPSLVQLETADAAPHSAGPVQTQPTALKIPGGWKPPAQRHRVIDLFSGCGGLALGFGLFSGGRVFRTVLGLDIEEAMVRAFNDNLGPGGDGPPVGRRIDLSDFLNEAEVLAFYLDHIAALERDKGLSEELGNLPFGSLSSFKAAVAELDRAFLADLQELRATEEYREAASSLESTALGQTSVIGFHNALGLPMPGARATLPPILWSDASPGVTEAGIGNIASSEVRHHRAVLSAKWDSEIAQLVEKSKRTGRGQLASSAKKIRSFLAFARAVPMARVTNRWLAWKSRRDALRAQVFENDAALRALRGMYTGERRAQVILGGPPCQGFSRIGRGKIRSLRENGVHAQVDAEAGDERNLLLLKYTLFVAALRPAVFLFENVRHFQAEVKTPEGTFKASEVLAEAIREMSENGAEYAVAMKTVDCSVHLIPQTRERFVMAGVRSDVATAAPLPDVAQWLISLPVRARLPLKVALEMLPAPHVTGGAGNGSDLARTVAVPHGPNGEGEEDAATLYHAWVRRPRNAEGGEHQVIQVDAHVVRAGREDDRGLYWLMGPGTRWMDYRCDKSSTVAALRRLVSVAADAASALRSARQRPTDPALRELANLEPPVLEALKAAVDGSLSLRLLMECIPAMPGELGHHLLKETYLAKQEGNHGDWLARMDAEKPSKTIVSHMGKDTYAYIHPSSPRPLSVREAARVQTFPDWFKLGGLSLVDAFRVVGNAVPPLLSHQFADRISQLLCTADRKSAQRKAV